MGKKKQKKNNPVQPTVNIDIEALSTPPITNKKSNSETKEIVAASISKLIEPNKSFIKADYVASSAPSTDAEEEQCLISEAKSEGSVSETDSSGLSECESEDETEETAVETEEQPFQSDVTFSQLGLYPWLLEGLKRMAIQTPTEIQAKCIGPILEGRDVVGGAKTGSGKTAAFALPMLQKLAVDPYGVFGLVLTPTRELAFQLAEQFAALGEGINLKYCVVVGGLDMMKQAVDLSHRPHIIIATPGRLADLIRSSPDVIHLKRLSMLVLDEADLMLTPTFAEDLGEIFNVLPEKRQTLLFTATMTKSVTQLIQTERPGRPTPFIHLCQSSTLTVKTLKQNYIFIPSYVREAYLVHLLAENAGKSVMIFTARVHTAELLKILLCKMGHQAVALHSNMPQRGRIDAIARFKAAHTTTLVSTDVGSRGLDIPAVQLVINYDLPQDPSNYIHRVGRTARAGRGGSAVSFVTEKDVTLVHDIEERVGSKMEELTISENKVLEIINKVSEAKREAKMIMLDGNFGEKQRIRSKKNGIEKPQTRPQKRKNQA
ncbi:putative RNA helicase [Entomophthora muscae]|uniref:RNA helicase n=1 Tax=Entomophthora muscae TaxID=34485 RepID=A0ACC2RFY7_9FUNG|nr:putative RNA helicase [Entomophthora muscae]